MNKIKLIVIVLLIPIFILIAFTFLRIKRREDFHQKTILAYEIRKVLDYLMVDLSQAKESSMLDLPADGQWHNRIAFSEAGQGSLEYFLKDGILYRDNKGQELLIADHIAKLRIRHQQETPDIIEVQINAQSNVSMISNFKVRIRD